MVRDKTRLQQEAFGECAEALPAIDLQSQRNAVDYLRSIFSDPRGARLLYGPASSGKSTIVRRFAAAVQKDVAVAVIDGTGMAPKELVSQVLSRFGYHVELQSVDDLVRMLKVFLVQQTRACQAPIIIVENIDRMQPGTLRVLCLLAALTFERKYATRIVLTGYERAPLLLKSEGMAAMAKRIVVVSEVEPLSPLESLHYLLGRLSACGVRQPLEVFSQDVCEKIHAMSAGLPGLLNENARGTLQVAESLPVTEADVETQKSARSSQPPSPQLIVTSNGKTIEEYVIREKKVTIGRSSLADLVIYNEYASKFHILMLLDADALVLVDLNSSNGTFVNSLRVDSTILRSNDIISIASHRIKVLNAPDSDAGRIEPPATDDTAKMKTLTAMREDRKMQFPFLDIKRRHKE